MATATRPRPARHKSIEELLAERSEIKRMISRTDRQAARIMGDEEANRSTRVQRMQRLKTTAWDELKEFLSGKG